MYSWPVVLLYPLFSILLHNREVETFDLQNIINDLAKINISCTDDNCREYEEDSLLSRDCQCGMHCAQLGTCCFDSSYADVPKPELTPTCRYVHNSGYYFLVDQCTSTDSVWAGLCNCELSEADDVQSIVPVISLLTSITYKNYYCYKCNEASDEFLYWTLVVKSKNELPTTSEDESKELAGNISFIYNKSRDTIMATYDDEIDYFSVKSSLQFPSATKNLTHICESGVISNCSDEWSDDEIRNKCLSYMSLKKVVKHDGTTINYKNIHCALCNYENLTDVYCRTVRRYGYGNRYGGGYGGSGHRGGYGGSGHRRGYGGHRGGGGGYGFNFTHLLDINRDDDRYRDRDDDRYRDRDDGKYRSRDDDKYRSRDDDRYRDRDDGKYRSRDDDKYRSRDDRYGFTFTYLLDINRSEGEVVGKTRKCSYNHIWDRFSKKCRKLVCAIPGFKVKNMKCVEE